MSGTAKLRQDSATLFSLVAIGLALVTILSVWKLKQFKYRLINETGGAMFYGMLVGLTVRYLSFGSGEHMNDMEAACVCGGFNSTPRILTVNITSHFHCFRRVGKINHRCPPVSTPHTLCLLQETFDPEVLFNLFLPPIIFHGAYTLNQKRFIANLGSVVTFAFLGTIISCMTIGACVYGFTRLMVLLGQAADGDFFLTDCLLFGAIMSATDPGIVAVLFCGLSQARYTIYNLSSEGRTRTKQLFEVFNFLGEIFIFSYMGYVLLAFPHHVFKALFITGAFLSIFISRACNIYPFSFLLNLGRTTKIPCSFQHFMMFAGFRGAVAFSLAIRDTTTEVRRTILTTTLLLVGFTVWVLGTAAHPVLHRLNIRVGVDADENPEDFSFEVATGRPDTTRGLWHRLDYKYLKPVLTHCGPPLSDSLPQWCGLFGRLFSSPRVQEDEEQLCEIEPDDFTFDLEETENQLGSIGGHSGSVHQEDLLEGDLGLGTAPALAREA
ncbi:sodium/hydrogen exchanger 9-like isoform X3 [Sebastes umbrosus]|uniref:sodium/hydrogen exchanger 9-like isoform X3 n=1 Tax=Sebastes umbrosus TaxID=72105 RepID=UPI00189D1EEC|nr:sodium/hydrogen exchanger 9-like isoform X3 [Sebastes umbrosus]